VASSATAQNSSVVKAVAPDYSADAGKPTLTIPAAIGVLVLPDGSPYSIHPDVGLPHNVVAALAQYRFQSSAREYTVLLPFQLQIATESYYGTRRNHLLPPEWVAAAKKLDPKKALQLEQRLQPTAESVSDRTVLLVWALGRTDDAAREMRARQIAWLVENQPLSEVLRSTAAFINSTVGPLADPSAYSRIRQLWLDAVAKAPTNSAVLEGAYNFLRISDPQEVRRILAPYSGRYAQITSWLADTYSMAALGVTSLAIGPGMTEPATAMPKLPETPFAASSRALLLESKDLVMLLSAFLAIRTGGIKLAREGFLPEGYNEFCESLADRIRSLKPDPDLHCRTLQKTDSVILPKRTRGKEPSYPKEAAVRGTQGAVTFEAIVDKTGKIKDLAFLGGPLALYESARSAIQQWEFQPATINGAPFEIIADIEVNFNLSRK